MGRADRRYSRNPVPDSDLFPVSFGFQPKNDTQYTYFHFRIIQCGRDLVSLKVVTYNLHHFQPEAFGKILCPVDEGGVILEQTLPIRMELFHHRVKVISWMNLSSFCAEKFSQSKPSKHY